MKFDDDMHIANNLPRLPPWTVLCRQTGTVPVVPILGIGMQQPSDYVLYVGVDDRDRNCPLLDRPRPYLGTRSVISSPVQSMRILKAFKRLSGYTDVNGLCVCVRGGVFFSAHSFFFVSCQPPMCTPVRNFYCTS